MSKVPRKLFGRSPWREKTSAGSFTTVSSSVGNVLRGPTPPVTPMSIYTAKRELIRVPASLSSRSPILNVGAAKC